MGADVRPARPIAAMLKPLYLGEIVEDALVIVLKRAEVKLFLDFLIIGFQGSQCTNENTRRGMGLDRSARPPSPLAPFLEAHLLAKNAPSDLRGWRR